MKGSNSLGENLFQEKPSTDQPPRGVYSTGTWGLSRKEKCLPVKSCLICGTAPLTSASEMDAKLLKTQKDKFKQKSPGQLLHKNFNKKKDFTAKVAEPQECNNKSLAGAIVPSSFSAAALSTFKIGKRRRMALFARSGIKDQRPPPEYSNIWRQLIDSRQGYKFAARTLSRILRMVRAAGSRSTAGPKKANLYQKFPDPGK